MLINKNLDQTFYVYMIYEYPIEKPYYFKIGYSNSPLRRLDELQAGNPRALRCWDYEVRPTENFGFEFPSEHHARRFEANVIKEFEYQGLRLRRDMDCDKFQAPAREWFSHLHPSHVWNNMNTMYFEYIKTNLPNYIF